MAEFLHLDDVRGRGAGGTVVGDDLSTDHALAAEIRLWKTILTKALTKGT